MLSKSTKITRIRIEAEREVIETQTTIVYTSKSQPAYAAKEINEAVLPGCVSKELVEREDSSR